MKLTKQTILKMVVGAGLCGTPMISNAQNINIAKTKADVVTGFGASYAIGKPQNTYDVTAYGSYGIMHDVYGKGEKFHGMAMAVCYGAVSDTHYKNYDNWSCQFGGIFKVGMGYRNFVLTGGKGCVVSVGDGLGLLNMYSVGLMFNIGEYTKLCTDWNYITSADSNRNDTKTLGAGIIYTLRRRQK